jgi:lipopolysaccharide export system permease protein
MNVIHRYIFRRLLAAFLITFPALTISIWLTQALSQLNLVTERGQGFGVFVEASVLLLPALILVVGPITMLIAVTTTINWLHSDSELVSLGASGAAPAIMLRPVLALAVPLTLVAAACSLYLNPYAAGASNSLVAAVNANVITTLIRPGEFRSLGDDVVMQISAIHPDGTLEGIFVFDRRLRGETVAYIAGAGAMVENEFGQYLLMQDGVIQRRTAGTNTVSAIEFRSYAFDLSSLASQTAAGDIKPNERPLDYLLNPDRNDPIYQANPYRYTSEFHNRTAKPLYVLVLAVLPLAMLGRVRSSRQGRGRITLFAVAAGIALMVLGMTLEGTMWTNSAMLPATYGVPLGAIALSLLWVWSGRSLPSLGLRRRDRPRKIAPGEAAS